GTNTCCAPTDQRGVARYYGHNCEVGSFEFVPCPVAPTKPELVSPAPPKNKVKKTKPLLDWAGPDCATKWKVLVRQDSRTGDKVFVDKKLLVSQATTTTALSR